MHRSVHILACAAVVFHIVGGCCWHHAHAACPGDCGVAPQKVACRSSDGHGCADHDACPAEHRQGDHHECDSAPCVFVVPETDDPAETAPVQGIASMQADADLAPRASSLAAHPAGALPSHLPGDLRLHLVNQVLLL